MVALVTATLFVLVLSGLIVLYARRRPAGAPVTWGEAMVGSLVVFFIMFLAYGTVPHQWLTWAENEQGWTADRIVYGPFDILKPKAVGGHFPFSITYRTVSDSIAALIYIVFLGGMSTLWAMWQSRGSSKGTDVVKSTYGRPLIKRG